MVSIRKVLRRAPRKARHKKQKCIIQNRKIKQITMKKKTKILLLVNLKSVTKQPNRLKIVVVIVGVVLVKKLALLFEAGKKQKI